VPRVSGLLEQLRQRKLVQWALAYGAAAFALLQGVDIVAQQFGWADGVRRGITIALLMGFFVTLVLAWYHGERGAQRVSGAELLILALLLAIGGAILWRFAPGMRETGPTAQSVAARRSGAGDRSVGTKNDSAAADRKSIAVLPFESLSEDKANAYFASGMQDMILTKLSGIGDMKVISRTSTQKYASHPDNLKSIALELGVATILEGSVQKAGNDVLINVQLIDAGTDAHVWAEAYPRTLENIFGVEGEVAQKIAASLHAALTRDERVALENKPTRNVAAYDAYLRGLALARSATSSQEHEQAAGEFRTAVRLDQGFALAWAELVWLETDAYWFGFDTTPARLAAAKATLDRAEALAPDLPQVQMARAVYLYHGLRDFAGAMTVIRKAQLGLPNDARVWFVSAIIERRVGKWDEALADYARARSLDPNDPTTIWDIQLTYIVQHRFAEALKVIDADIEAHPEFFGISVSELEVFAEWDLGGLDAVDRVLRAAKSDAADVVALRARQALYRRDFRTASDLFGRAIAAGDDVRSVLVVAAYLPASVGWQLLQALSEQRGGSPETAAKIYARVQELARAGLAEKSGSENANAAWHAILGEANAGLGQRDAAVTEGRAAVALIPESVDAFEGPYWQDCLARIYALNGDAEHARPLIERLLRTNGSMITPAMLKFDPVWDSIRDDPAFNKLLETRPDGAPRG
jgi:TolB-like protein